jgi:hypothetical protein
VAGYLAALLTKTAQAMEAETAQPESTALQGMPSITEDEFAWATNLLERCAGCHERQKRCHRSLDA